MDRGRLLALGLMASIAAIPAIAHHSFDSAFDRNKLVTLSGTVTEFKFIEPHAYLRLSVSAADGTAQNWLVETTSLRNLASHGWTPQSIKIGEKLSVSGWQARDGNAYLRLRAITQADGDAVSLWLPSDPTPLRAEATRAPAS